MDPVTAALQLGNTIAGIYKTMLEKASPTQAEKIIDLIIVDMQKWRDLLDRFHKP